MFEYFSLMELVMNSKANLMNWSILTSSTVNFWTPTSGISVTSQAKFEKCSKPDSLFHYSTSRATTTLRMEILSSAGFEIPIRLIPPIRSESIPTFSLRAELIQMVSLVQSMAGSKLDWIQYLRTVSYPHGGCGPIMASGIMRTLKGKYFCIKYKFNILVVSTRAQNQTTPGGDPRLIFWKLESLTILLRWTSTTADTRDKMGTKWPVATTTRTLMSLHQVKIRKVFKTYKN